MTIYILSTLALLLLLYIARKPRTANNRQGKLFNATKSNNLDPSDKQNNVLTVATYNVQTGKNLLGKRDINRAAEVLRHVDIAGIQEVYARSWSNHLGVGLGQTESLAKPGNFNWLFCPTRYRWFKENRGNAILSKLPVESWETNMLPDKSGISFRNMSVVKFEWQGQSCHFINTHLHTAQGKEQQLQVVLNEFNKYSRVILAGDFNCKPDTALLVDFLQTVDVDDAILQAGINQDNNERIDWILTRGWKIISGKKIDKGISDHPYYEVSLELS